MPAITTSQIAIPKQIADDIWKKLEQGSALAALTGSTPMKFGNVDVMTFTNEPVAELVGEGAKKSETPMAMAPKSVVPRKLQVTVRTSNEVQWADEDYQLGVFNAIKDAGANALARALDLVGIHKLNPLAGTVADTVTEGIIDSANTVSLGSSTDYVAALEAAQAMVIANDYVPTGYAFDTSFANGLRHQRDANGTRLPEVSDVKLVGLGSFDGAPAVTSSTVSAKKEAKSATNVKAIVGQADAFKWGVQRDIMAELIEFGDPDGLGDLKRMNQIAVRLEIVYGIGIMDPDAFAIVTA